MGWNVGLGILACVLILSCGNEGGDSASGDAGQAGEGGSIAGAGPQAGAGGLAGNGGSGAGSGGVAGGDLGGEGGVEAGAGGTDSVGGESGSGAGGDGPEPDDVVEIPEVDETGLPEPAAEAGFVEIAPASYEAPLEPTRALRSERTRLFYSFIPADADAKQKPLFVFFNGGPGSTSMLLFSCGTGRYSLDADDLGALPTANPHVFTRLGNLLYIDSRHAGFSYGVTDDATSEAERARAFGVGSFNAAVDGADFVRVLLRVLENVPAIRNNPVVIVGESYGGTRAAVMLDVLLDPHSAGASYQEASLAAALDAHYAAVFPGVAPERIDRSARALQFGWQVLIQPLVAGSSQYDARRDLLPAALERMAADLGISTAELETERCTYDTSRTDAWCSELDAAVTRTVTTPATFALLAGVGLEVVPGLRASERTGSFRFIAATGAGPDPSSMTSLLGSLSPWDRYFNPTIGQSVFAGFDRVFQTPIYAVPFLRAARNAHTIITNARLDTVVLSDSIVPALNAIVPLLTDVWFTGAEYTDPVADPPTRVRLSYAANDDLGPAAERSLYMPTYAESGHFVSVAQPEQLFEDVSAFLAETGLGE